jgi:2-dehydro-3-deoxyphosphooctonate aldolase (KDO 8-P synthase)
LSQPQAAAHNAPRLNEVVEVKTPNGAPVRIGNGLKLSIIAGPCQLESRQHALETAHALKEIGERLNVGIIYKTSFDKANRTSASAARGIGLKARLPIFAEIREVTGLPTLTDVHEKSHCAPDRRGRRCAADPGLPEPPDRPAAGRRRDRQGRSTSRRASSWPRGT